MECHNNTRLQCLVSLCIKLNQTKYWWEIQYCAKELKSGSRNKCVDRLKTDAFTHQSVINNTSRVLKSSYGKNVCVFVTGRHERQLRCPSQRFMSWLSDSQGPRAAHGHLRNSWVTYLIGCQDGLLLYYMSFIGILVLPERSSFIWVRKILHNVINRIIFFSN